MNNRHPIGILHPGEMGSSIAASARESGRRVCWVSAGRSEASRERARRQELEEIPTLQELCECCPIIVSVCPPHAAEAMAEEVLQCGYRGIYVDANAISPERARRMAAQLESAGIPFVDGGIIGPPAWKPGTTWLYLSGKEAHKVVDCLASGPLSIRVIGEEPGRASALKMVFAARNKGVIALNSAVLAAAEAMGVRRELEMQWTLMDPHSVPGIEQDILRSAPKAWRFTGEMEEIAATLRSCGVPADFHLGAKEIYQRLAGFKGMAGAAEIQSVLEAILGEEPK